jgi:hypothetical protein
MGSMQACPSAMITPYWWMGYAGLGDTTASPGPIVANSKWASASLAPMVTIASLSESKVTP